MGKEIKYWIVFTIIFLGSAFFVYELLVKDQFSDKTKPVKVISKDGSVIQNPPTALKVAVLKDRHIIVLAEKDVDKNGFADQILVTADYKNSNDSLRIDFVTYDTNIKQFAIVDSYASSINTYRNIEHRFLADQGLFILWGKNAKNSYYLETYSIVKNGNLLSMLKSSLYESDVLPQFIAENNSINFDETRIAEGIGFTVYSRYPDNPAKYDKKFYRYNGESFDKDPTLTGTEIFFNTYLDASNISGTTLVRDTPQWLDGIWEKEGDSTIDLFMVDTKEEQITLMRDHLLETYIEDDRPLLGDNSVYIRAHNKNVNTIMADFIITKTEEDRAEVKIIWTHDEESVSIKKVARTEYETKFGLISNKYTDYSSICVGIYDDIALESRVIFKEGGSIQEIISTNVANGQYICYKWNDTFILEMDFLEKKTKKVYQVVEETTESGTKALWLMPIKITSNGIIYLGERNKYLVQVTEIPE